MGNIKSVRKTVYRCKVCGAEYDDRIDAKEGCGSYELEPPIFKVGDRVTVWYASSLRGAKVVGIRGPIVGNSFKDGKRRFAAGAHVYQYLLKPTYRHSNFTMKDIAFWTSDLTRA